MIFANYVLNRNGSTAASPRRLIFPNFGAVSTLLAESFNARATLWPKNCPVIVFGIRHAESGEDSFRRSIWIDSGGRFASQLGFEPPFESP